MPWCRLCSTDQPDDAFYYSINARTGHRRRRDCKACTKRVVGERRRNDPDHYARVQYSASARSRLKARQQALDHYGRRCACCGIDDEVFLTFDHVDGEGAAHRKRESRSMALPLWLRSHGYPEGFQTLCFNCNYAKFKLGVCPHNLRGGSDP